MLRGGLIGCGYVSRYHLQGWRRQKAGRLVAVCDLDDRRAAEAATEAGAVPYASPEAMFENESLDFVEICTRPDSHETLVELAAKHNAHVLCQKPVAGDLATIDRMAAAIEVAGVRMMVHENWRFRPWYLEAANLLRSGVVGRPVRLRVNAHDFRCLAPGGMSDQPYFATMPRFILLEMGPHLIDVARHLFGDPDSIYCALGKAGTQAGEDSAHLVLRYGDGRLAVLDMCWTTAQHPEDNLSWGLCETIIEGAQGCLRTTAEGRLLLQSPDGDETSFPVGLEGDPRVQSYCATQTHFLERLIDGNEFATSLADNRRAMQILFAGYESADRGESVRLDMRP